MYLYTEQGAPKRREKFILQETTNLLRGKLCAFEKIESH